MKHEKNQEQTKQNFVIYSNELKPGMQMLY